MNTSQPKSRIGQKTVYAAVCEIKDDDKYKLLESTLILSKFWEGIESLRKKIRVSKGNFKIIIKTDLDIFEIGAPTGTDPQLVEHLLDLLFEYGYREIIVADSISSSDAWLENRDVIILADMIGYKFVTKRGNQYNLINLSEDLIEYPISTESILNGMQLSKSWVDAHCRIIITKNKTDEENRYALGLQNLLNVLPLRDKEYHYHDRFKSWDLCIEIFRQTPIHFSIIEAVISNHGNTGTRVINPIQTNTIIASSDLLLTDWIGALKMGLDPYVSRLNEKVLRTFDLPKKYQIIGSLTPYIGWKNVSPLLSESVIKRNEIPHLNRIIKPWLQSVNKEIFPFKNIIDEQINSYLTKIFSDIDSHPLSYWAMILLNYIFIGAYKGIEAYRILFDKDNLLRKKVPLDFNIADYNSDDYEEIIDYMTQLENIVQYIPKDKNGLRWRYIDKSVLFKYSRILPIPYKDFITKVKIQFAVQMMYDNIGGAYVPVTFDNLDRVKYQAERNIYLPQPNWMVLFGGQTIDVGKIEIIKYEKNSQKVFWRTVNSSNKSADFDDGVVTFAKCSGGTEITIVARQKFSLPIIWQVLDLDYIPQIKDILLSDAYNTFFSRTISNYEAVFEGRDTRIGKNWDGSIDDTKNTTIEQFTKLFTVISNIIEQLIRKNQITPDESKEEIDEIGYRHFTSSTNVNQINNLTKSFIKDLFEAFSKDFKFIYDNFNRN